MTKIDIISGFLGAGKTTFIKKLLAEAISGEQVVLIENEFGEIGIDGGFLKDSGIEIREMNSGCICCSLVGDFGRSLTEVLTKYHPDRIIIEPSGVGKLSDVMKAVRDVAEGKEVILNSAVTIVDASKCKMYMKNFGEFFNDQIAYSGTIVLSRTDIADSKKVQEAVELIRSQNQQAVLITTPCNSLSGSQLLEIIENPISMEQDLLEEVKEHHHAHDHEHHHDHDHDHDHHHEHGEDCNCGCHDHDHHHADEIFTSWGLEATLPCTREQLDEVLNELANGSEYGEVLRAKGMLPDADSEEWFYFDLVPNEYQIRTGKPYYTGKVCVIGADLKEDQLKKAFGRR